MRSPALPSIRVTPRPGRTPSPGIFVPALALGAALCAAACGPSSWTNAYNGTASLESEQGPQPALANQSVEVMSCTPPTHADAYGQPAWTPPFAILRVGGQCAIEGTWSGATFLAETGGQCVLPIADEEVTIHVTDAVVRRTLYETRHGSYEDDSYVEVRIGGDRLPAKATTDHVLFAFKGAIVTSTDATEPCLEAYERRKAAGKS
jgi:hypothetical protein